MGFASQLENDLEKNSDAMSLGKFGYGRSSTSAVSRENTNVTEIQDVKSMTMDDIHIATSEMRSTIATMQDQITEAKRLRHNAPAQKGRGKIMRFLFGRLGEAKDGRYL
jgi:hypothetical protein